MEPRSSALHIVKKYISINPKSPPPFSSQWPFSKGSHHYAFMPAQSNCPAELQFRLLDFAVITVLGYL